MLDVIPITVFAENLFRCVKNKDAKGLLPTQEGFNPYLELFDFQKEILDFMFTVDENGELPFKSYLWSCPKKSGKAISLNSLIPTPSGFVFMKDIKLGDIIFDGEGKKTKVNFVSEVFYNHKCYKITFTNGEQIIADAGHQWFVGSRYPIGEVKSDERDIYWGVLTTEEMQTRSERFAIPIAKDLELSDQELPIPPYTLGIWLGDGNSRGAAITVGEGDEEICEQIRREGVPCVARKKNELRAQNYSLTYGRYGKKDTKIQNKLRRLKLLENKHIPIEYLRSSRAQRLELLRGLMDSDGYVSKDGRCEFTSVNNRLARQVHHLLASLGIKSKVTSGKALLNGVDHGPKYRIHFQAYSDESVFNLKRKTSRLHASKGITRSDFIRVADIEEIESEPVKCIQVESSLHTYLVGKGLVPTHNTMVNSLICAWFGFGLLPALGMPDEIIMAANSKEHSAGRVYQGVRYAVLNEPLLRAECNDKDIGLWKIKTKAGIEFKAIASDAGTAAGANFSLVSFDELWAMRTEGDRMLYEELTPVPTKMNSCRFISTYAGIPGESEELEELYHKAVDRLESEYGKGERVHPTLPLYVNRDASICAYWDHEARLPWHTPEYLQQQRATLRPHAYLRLWENRWTAGEDGIDILDWNKCVRNGAEAGWTEEKAWAPDKRIRLAVGIDASMKKDRSAVVTCFRKKVIDPETQKSVDKIFLGPRLFWQPDANNPMDYEESIEKFILELQKNYMLEIVYYDPYQFHRSAMTLWKKGVRMEEYTQTVPHGTEMCNHLLDLLRLGNLVMYEDAELRKEATAVSLKEVPGRGYRITKDTASKKIDSIVALAMAALAAEQVPSSDDDFKDLIFILPR